MTLEFGPTRIATLAIVMVCWIVFGIIFTTRRKPPKSSETKRLNVSRWGIVLQALSFAVTWNLPRQHFIPSGTPKWLEIIFAVLTAAIAVSSICLCLSAVRTLGKQWALVARVVEGHQLITNGPYALVRNPIYLGIFGMLVATALVFSRWWMLCIGVVLFLIGNSIRIKSEEQLLRESFGQQFEDYTKRVPAMFPRFL